MEQEDWVLVSLFDELLSGVFQQEAVTVVEWVSNLESVDSVSSSLLSDIEDLLWSKSVLIHAIVEFDMLGESHFLS
jgi:hypothetical protein